MAWVDGEQLRQLQAAQDHLQRIEPFAGDAERIARTYENLARQSINDPEITASGIFAEAVGVVERQRREVVVGRMAGEVATAYGAQIEQAIIDKDGPAIQAEVEARFETDEAPHLRGMTEARVRRDLGQETLARLREEKPTEYAEAFLAEHRDRIIAETTQQFERDEAAGIRDQAERNAQYNLTQETKRQLRADAEAAGKQAAYDKQLAAEILKLRLERMQAVGKQQQQIPLGQFEHGDVIVVELCPEDTSFDKQSAATVSRTLRFSMLDPVDGVVRVMDDSWRGAGEPALQGMSYKSGTLLTLQPAEQLALPEEQRERLALMRSIPLPVARDNADATLHGYELHRVKLHTPDGEKIILGPDARW
jgi:hypothetical protein